MLNRAARRAQLRAKVTVAEKHIRRLHACRDWLGLEQALRDYWSAAAEWRAA